MSVLNDLVAQIEDKSLRDRIAAEIERVTKQKKFGLVFEEHLPECTPLYDITVKKGGKVALKAGKINDVYTVLKIEEGKALCVNKDKSENQSIARYAIQRNVADTMDESWGNRQMPNHRGRSAGHANSA